MPDGQIKPLDRMPILWIAMGRPAGRQDRAAEHGGPVFPGGWQPDPRVERRPAEPQPHAVGVLPDAEEVPNAGLEDGKTWIEERIEDLIRHRYDAVLDVGGGATGFSRLVQEVPLLEAIEGSAVRVVGLFCIGPETADLDYLEQFAEVDMFMPAATVIVANGGLVLSGRSVGGAFKPILEHSAIRAAMAKGGRLAMFPALSCMSQVTDRGLTFTEAAKGQAKPGGEPLALFDRARVNRWWTRDVPEFFANIPREWLPIAAAEARESEAG